jgi:sulfate transport system substrate-binding protein
MKAKLHRLLILGSIVLPIVAFTSCRFSESQSRTIIVYGFSTMEDVMKQEIIPAFQRDWKEKTGEELKVITSFAGSGIVTNQIIFGAPADIAMVATEIDALNMKKAGLVTTDWRSFKNQGTYAYSITCILTRKGNPKGLHSFEDLTRPGVEVVYPDPSTSGGAQWAILALYGAALKTSEGTNGVPERASARDLLKRVSLNAGSLPESARRALTQFGLGYGDVLLTYENEALLDIAKGKEYEIVVPKSTIHIEPKVVIVDKNVDKSEEKVVKAFVNFLWTKETQEALARNHFRVWDEGIMKNYANRYKRVELPFTVNYLGGWEAATANVIEQTWTVVQREVK